MIFKLCDLNKARFDQIKKILSLIFELLSTTFIQTSEHSKINKIIRDFFYKTMLFKLDHFQALFLDGIQKHKLSRTHFLSQKWQNIKTKSSKNSSWTNPGWCLQSGSSGDDLNEFSSNDSLPGSVVGQGQLVNHFTCKNTKKINAGRCSRIVIYV